MVGNACPALLPDWKGLWGPVTNRQFIRVGVGYAAILLLGLSINWFAESVSWKTFGLGLLFPGNGFLAYANILRVDGWMHLGLAVCMLALFVMALVIWFTTGNVLAPPIVWLVSAVAAAMMRHYLMPFGVLCANSTLPYGLGMLLPVVTGVLVLWCYHDSKKQRQEANHFLKTSANPIALSFKGYDDATMLEFTLAELQQMRFVLDRALQPANEFNGFEWLDQFQTAAVRYQLNFMGYALSMAQATHLPAFRGYLHEAQHRLIRKQTDHRVWRYWEIESLWGRLKRDANPINRENIMFTGFCATQMAMFHAASGQRDYELPNSFQLLHPSGKLFLYDFPALVATLEDGFRASDFYLMACEPNWIYPLCNSIGAAAIKAYDRQNNQQHWLLHQASFRQSLEQEFIDPAGRFVPCRSAHTGFALPITGGALPQAMTIFFLNATLPDIALRQWLLLRPTLLTSSGELNQKAFWPIDTGNYRFSKAAAYAGTALAAVEMGDTEVAHCCFNALDEHYPAETHDGVMHRANASVWAHAVELFARADKSQGFRHLMAASTSEKQKPYISRARYPDILVASAFNQLDTLIAVLYPGVRPGCYQIEIAGLSANQMYLCKNAQCRQLIADAQGKAMIDVVLDGRTEIHIKPSVGTH